MTDEEYYEFIQPYEDAKQMLLTRLDVLNHNLYGDASARPIHNIQCRIKKKQSIEEKLQRKGKEPTVMNAKDYLQDIAGVRVICYFVDDIYNLTELLKSPVSYTHLLPPHLAHFGKKVTYQSNTHTGLHF